MLSLSTAHIKEGDNDLLDKDVLSLVVKKYEYGWIIWIPALEELVSYQFIDAVRSEGFSLVFYSLLLEARAHDCNYLMFDKDVEPDPALTKFEW